VEEIAASGFRALRRTSLGSEFARHFGEFLALEDVRKEVQIHPRVLP
jgi:hypothetical protein